ncbi:hypothetical protein PMIN01_09239 [Paraphaeosphaeria minitans]|uniref:Uncharacterized protein n=1 Tax=Paraphaeosphaeria minitans TaxID=565426 RepID=A0A9P6GAZ6_9PLEO|nr:hypothetical protein PMIN01_09239 [Paraphaeosphaeria minitans]
MSKTVPRPQFRSLVYYCFCRRPSYSSLRHYCSQGLPIIARRV